MTFPHLIGLFFVATAFTTEVNARNEKQEIEKIIRGDDVGVHQKTVSSSVDENLDPEDNPSQDDTMALPLTQGFFGDMGDEEKKNAAEAAASDNTKIFYVKDRESHKNLTGYPVLDPNVVEKVSTQMEEREKKKKSSWWDQFLGFLGLGS